MFRLNNSADINIDRLVNYKTEYSKVIKQPKFSGNNLIGLCPFHNDTNSSFSVDLATGKFDCFACGASGNYIGFVARQDGISTKDAYKKILREHGVEPPQPAEQPRTETGSNLGSLTIQEYSLLKNIPADWLATTCHLSTEKDKNGTRYLKVPYLLEGGVESTFRKRYADKQFRWKYGSSGKICLYGDWRLPEIRDKGYCILVEGESDTQTLWYLGFPTLGVAGASLFKAEQTARLQDLKVYLHVEPDLGGQTFLTQMKQKLRQGEFIGKVYTWSCSQFGVKDPSDLYIKYGVEEATKKISTAIQNAVEEDIYADTIPEAISGAPVNLRQPTGWTYSDNGISRINEKTFISEIVCRTPIIITRRLTSLETGEEKIEIAFKRDKKWTTAVFLRSTLFQSKSIVALADLGCTITSENAKHVVSFLGALEAENIDIIDKADSTRTFGWQPGNRFLPGLAKDVVLDIEPSQRTLAAAYSSRGTMEEWVELMQSHRERDRFRFILAASFAAPLLKILQQRIFFVYNWGNSAGGKTAGLKAALSVWGEPDKLMVNFNATQVALERMAAFYCDLPLGIDERQLAGNNQGSLEKIVYMIASGTGRARGSKGGGLQHTSTWRTIALATGEEPLSTDTTQTGVANRVIEVYGGPFDNEKEASKMHQDVSNCYGHAGTEFVKKILELDEEEIRNKYDSISKHLSEKSGGKNGAHIAGIAGVTLADMYIDEWFFNGTDSESRALSMAETVLDGQSAREDTSDVNESARQFIFDWVMSNRNFFGTNCAGTCYGTIDDNCAYIFPMILNQALSKAGYSPRKTLKYLAENGYIETARNGTKERLSVTKRFDGNVCRFIQFSLDNTEIDSEYQQSTIEEWQSAEGYEPLPF